MNHGIQKNKTKEHTRSLFQHLVTFWNNYFEFFACLCTFLQNSLTLIYSSTTIWDETLFHKVLFHLTRTLTAIHIADSTCELEILFSIWEIRKLGENNGKFDVLKLCFNPQHKQDFNEKVIHFAEILLILNVCPKSIWLIISNCGNTGILLKMYKNSTSKKQL